MIYQIVLSTLSIILLFFPELFRSRYAHNIMWDAISRSYNRDSQPIRDFFLEIENNFFGESPRKPIVTKYFEYGLDIVSFYISLGISGITIMAAILLFNSPWIRLMHIIILSFVIVLGLELHHLISENRPNKRSLNVYDKKLMWFLKTAALSINGVVLILGIIFAEY